MQRNKLVSTVTVVSIFFLIYLCLNSAASFPLFTRYLNPTAQKSTQKENHQTAANNSQNKETAPLLNEGQLDGLPEEEDMDFLNDLPSSQKKAFTYQPPSTSLEQSLLREELALLRKEATSMTKSEIRPNNADTIASKVEADDDSAANPQGNIPEDNQATNNNLIGGVLTPNLRDILSEVQSADTAISNEPTPADTPVKEEEFFYTGQPRGLALLAFMQPEARDTIEKSMSILAEAKLSDPAIAILLDGTFAYDPGFVRRQMMRLAEDPIARLHVILYLASGPTMRRSEETPIETAFSRLSPEQFGSNLLDPESDTHRAFIQKIERANQITNIIKSINNAHQVYIAPVLEDNLSRTEYLAAQSLLRQYGHPSAILVRNPESPYEHQATENNSEIILEVHRTSQALDTTLKSRPISLSLDGQSFRFSNEEAHNELSVGFDELDALLRSGTILSLQYVLFWRPEWQGLAEGTQLTHPTERRYEALQTAEQQEELLYLLRSGLTRVSRR